MIKTHVGWFMGGMALTLALALSGGCSKKVTSASVRGDMSPALASLTETQEQRANTHAATWDLNTRQAWDDVDRILFNDRPMRLTIYPIP